MTESPGRSSQPDSEEPARRSPRAIQDLGTAEVVIALTDVSDELEVLGRSRGRQLRDSRSWTVLGVLLLLFGVLVGGGAPYFLAALFPFLAAARDGRSYLQSRLRWRELRAMLGPLKKERWERSRKATQDPTA